MKMRSKWVLLGVGIILATGFACKANGSSTSMQPRSGNHSPASWKTQEDPMGFRVALPPGWKVNANRNSGRVEILGTTGESVIVWPFFLSDSGAGMSAFSSADAIVVVSRLATRVWPDAAWSTPQPSGLTVVHLTGSRGDLTVVSFLSWISSPQGTAGYYYATAAPTERYHGLEDTFAKILASFRMTGAAAKQKPADAIHYIRWTDPHEQAFSLEVPAGWRVTGGMLRFASVDTRGSVEAVSSDDLIRVTVGDTDIPAFTQPTPTLAMSGFGEGSWYSPGYGVRMFVRRYLTGKEFVSEYVHNKVARICPGLNITDTRDITNTVNAQSYNSGFTAGEVDFTCHRDGRTFKGSYGAVTQQPVYGGVWLVISLGGYLAVAEKALEAHSVLEHMGSTFQMNPQWQNSQNNIAANTSQIVSQTQRQVSKSISDRYWNRQSANDEMSRRRSNATLGLEDVVDTNTGRQFKIESGSNYYWVDQRGTVVGTNTDTRPNLDFRELVRLP